MSELAHLLMLENKIVHIQKYTENDIVIMVEIRVDFVYGIFQPVLYNTNILPTHVKHPNKLWSPVNYFLK